METTKWGVQVRICKNGFLITDDEGNEMICNDWDELKKQIDIAVETLKIKAKTAGV